MTILVVVLGVLIVGLAIVVFRLASGGSVTIPFTDPPRILSFAPERVEQPWSPPKDKVAVPIAARKIPAYSQVTRDDFWNPQLQRLSVVYLEKEQVSKGMLTNLSDILGRVLSHDKGAGYVFTENDFLPEGTRPGLVAGIPAGMRAMRIELSKVRGLYGLQPGDRFDVLASIPVSSDAAKDLQRLGGAFAERVAMEASLSNTAKQATVRVIVQGGVVVTPVQINEIPVSVATTKGASRGGKPLQEVVVAVNPDEVTALAEAMAVDADLSVVPRSGRPDDPKDSRTPDRLPKSPFAASGESGTTGLSFVETIDGTRREIVPVPKPVQTPKEEPKEQENR
jgi:Flp pilus assembly protein CpaB